MADGHESARRAALEAAEAKAFALLAEVEEAGLIAPGRSERDVEEDIAAIAARRFGVKKHWHKRIVRAGANALTSFSDNPPLRTIAEDDLVYLDIGPVFEAWEADVGKTYALGVDPEKRRLVADLERLFIDVQRHFHATPDITGAELYAAACAAAEDAGWTFGAKSAGHIVAEFAHGHLPGNKMWNRIAPGNTARMRDLDTLGRVKHWILEIHLVDRVRPFGGFYERLL